MIKSTEEVIVDEESLPLHLHPKRPYYKFKSNAG